MSIGWSRQDEKRALSQPSKNEMIMEVKPIIIKLDLKSNPIEDAVIIFASQ